MDLFRRAGYRTVQAVGLLTALGSVYLLGSPMLLDDEHTGPLGAAAELPEVRRLLTFGSFQIAILSVAWGLLVAGLAHAAVMLRDRQALLAIWVAGVGAGLATAIRMALLSDWPGVAWNLVPVALLAGGLLLPLADQALRTVQVSPSGRSDTVNEREEHRPRPRV